jgi:hypothetical protein
MEEDENVAKRKKEEDSFPFQKRPCNIPKRLGDTSLTLAAFKTQIIKHDFINGLKLKHKRNFFASLRKEGASLHEGNFFTLYGITAGEFAVYQVLTEKQRRRGTNLKKKKKKKKSSLKKKKIILSSSSSSTSSVSSASSSYYSSYDESFDPPPLPVVPRGRTRTKK